MIGQTPPISKSPSLSSFFRGKDFVDFHTQKSKIQMIQETIKTNMAPAKILRFIRRLRRMRKEVQSKRNLSWVDKSLGATH